MLVLLQGEDPFSMKNIMQIGLKLFLAIAGGGGGNDKSDSSPVQVNIIEILFPLPSRARFKFGPKGRHCIDFLRNHKNKKIPKV